MLPFHFLLIILLFFINKNNALALEKDPIVRCKHEKVNACITEHRNAEFNDRNNMKNNRIVYEKISNIFTEESSLKNTLLLLVEAQQQSIEDINKEMRWWKYWQPVAQNQSKNEFLSMYKFIGDPILNSKELIMSYIYTKSENHFSHVNVSSEVYQNLQTSISNLLISISDIQHTIDKKNQQISLLNSELQLYQKQYFSLESSAIAHGKMCEFGCQEQYCPSN